MKTRMERYCDSETEMARTKKNENLYEDIYNNIPSSSGNLLDNESEIDVSKIKELIENREGYKRVKEYRSILKTTAFEDEQEEYDIYEDIDNKIYDINTILEDAKAKRIAPEREKYRNLRNTQYDILSKLDLNEQPETDEMATDFFTQDKKIRDLLKDSYKEEDGASNEQTSADLFSDLKGGDNTVLTEAIKEEKVNVNNKVDEEASFYTNHLTFTKDDFEGFQNLQTTVKKNNALIKVLITILTVILVALVIFLVFAIL